jgi:hypothetical protein
MFLQKVGTNLQDYTTSDKLTTLQLYEAVLQELPEGSKKNHKIPQNIQYHGQDLN